MPDASAYPLLRVRRRRRLRVRFPQVASGRARMAAVLIVAVAVLGALLLASRPAPPSPRRLLADALVTLEAGNYSAARRNAERAVEAAPDSAAAHAVLARALIEQGQGLAAEAELTRAEAAGMPATRLHQLIAHARLLQGDAAGALAEAAEAGPPFVGYAARVRAEALAAQGQRAAGQTVLERVVAADPRDARAWTALGRMRFDAGEMGGAAEAAATAARLAPGEPAALTLQGKVVRARFGLRAALPWFAAALKRDAYHHPALIEQAATLGDLGRYTEALAATRRALATRPGSAPALYLQAVMAMRGGRPELARKLLAAAGGELDGVPGALLLAGAADLATGRPEEAVTQWRRLLAAQPMNLTARRLLATALIRSHDPRGALEVLRPLALRGDADAYALLLTARGWEVAGDRGAAATFLDRAAGRNGGNAGLFASDDSLAGLKAAAAAAPGDPTYALSLIRGLMGGGDRAGALARARALAAAAPRDPAALLAWGDVLAAAGRFGEAAGVYARAADLQFDEPTMLRLADALGRAGRPADAAATLALYLGQNPQSLTARRLLGHWQVAGGQWDAAIATLEAVRGQVGNREAGLLAELALAYAGADDGATARAYGRAAYALQPMSAAVADAYGVALAADGEVAGARQLLDTAVALAPENPAYLAHRRQLG